MGLFDFLFKLFSKKETQENNASDNSILTNECYSGNNISCSENLNDSKAKYFIFDTETDGTHAERIALQLGWCVYDENRNLISSNSCILNQNIDFGSKRAQMAMKVNHITKEMIQKNGISPMDAYKKFVCDLSSCDTVVSHNLSFDAATVCNDLKRLNIEIPFYEKNLFCTMEISKPYVQSKDRNGRIKYPRLEETAGFLLYNDINKKFEGLHDALEDAKLASICFFKLLDLSNKKEIALPYCSISPYFKNRLDGIKEEVVEKKDLKEIVVPDTYKLDLKDKEALSGSISTNFYRKKVLILGDAPSGESCEELYNLLGDMGAYPRKMVVDDLDFAIIGDNYDEKRYRNLCARILNGEEITCLSASALLSLYNGEDEMEDDEYEIYDETGDDEYDIDYKIDCASQKLAALEKMTEYIKSAKKGDDVKIKLSVEEYKLLKEMGVFDGVNIKDMNIE